MTNPDNASYVQRLIDWLNDNASEDDIIAGVSFVGNNRGTLNSNWDIYDVADLETHVDLLSS